MTPLNVKGLLAAMRSIVFWALFPLVIPQAFIVRRNAPRLSGAAGASSGYVGSGRSVRLMAIGDAIIAGVGADTVAEALPGQVAEELAALHECQVSWTVSGLTRATSSGVMSRLLRNLMTVC